MAYFTALESNVNQLIERNIQNLLNIIHTELTYTHTVPEFIQIQRERENESRLLLSSPNAHLSDLKKRKERK